MGLLSTGFNSAPSRWSASLGLLALGVGATCAQATDWQASVDLRLVDSNFDRTYMDGGAGDARYDRGSSLVQLDRGWFALDQAIGQLWSAHVDASAWGGRNAPALGVSEAWLLFRPYPVSGFRLRVKTGAFYAPVSLENRASGWESPYTLTFSAIDSWLAAEVRTVGTEMQLDWLGTRSGRSFDLGLTAAVFGWNDAAGAVIADDGFVMTDRQTPIGGHVGVPGSPLPAGAKPFMEIDGRPGVYVGAEARYLDRLVVRALRYDNRADPTELDNASEVVAWHTRFSSVGVRYETADGWTWIAQWLDGTASIDPLGFAADWPFHSEYALLSHRFGPHTLSARYDNFRVDAHLPDEPDAQDAQRGRALTAAYLLDVSARLRVSVEWLLVAEHSYNREDIYGLQPDTTRSQVQLSVRYRLGSQIN